MASKEIYTISPEISNLKAYYRFESGTYLTTDSSGEGHTLTAIGDPAEDASGKFGGAVALDGNDAYSHADHADFKPTGAFTVGGWIKSSDNSSQVLFQSASTNTNRAGIKFYGVQITTGVCIFQSCKNTGTTLGTDYQQIIGTTDLNDGNWHFLVATWNGTHLNLYVDGVSDATAVAWANAPGYAATNYIRVGCGNRTGTNENFVVGSLDDVFLLNGTALSAEEVKGIYIGWKKYNGCSNADIKTINGTNVFSPEIKNTSLRASANLKAYYRFSSGRLTTDSSGEGHTLTAISDPAEDASGKFGGAVALDGNDAYSATDHADFKPTGNFTIGAWIKTSSTSAHIFQSKSQNTNIAGIYLRVSAGGLAHIVSGKNSGTTDGTDYQSVVSSTAVNNNAWHFIVGVWDGSYLRIYVDGVNESSEEWTNAPSYASTNYVRVGCGNKSGSNEEFLTGSLDDVFLLNGTALSASEVLALYSGPIKTFNGI